jgi:HD-like signal output (HDOD) protein
MSSSSLIDRFVEDIEVANDLPSLSGVPAELVASLSRPDTTVPELVGIIRRDPVIVSQVLRAANTAAYAGYAPVDSVHQALLRLGVVRVRQIALFASLYAAVPFRGARVVLQAFWRHSLGVALCAEEIAQRTLASGGEMLFLSGLLHDLGLLVIQSHYPTESLAAEHHAQRHGLTLAAAELAVLGTDHGELGAILGRHWALPARIVGALQGHHRLHQTPPEHYRAAVIVNLADAMWSGLGGGDFGEGTTTIDPDICEEVGLDPATAADVVEHARSEIKQAAAML